MNITPENRIKILEYKLAFEQELQVKKEFEEGSNDLNYRLSFFRNKLIKDNTSSQEQISNFDKIFMPNNENIDNNIDCKIEKHRNDQNSFIKQTSIESWLKKAYRQIAKLTHPDMLIGIKSEKIIKKFSKYYAIAQNAYEKNIPPDIIMVASELDVVIDNATIKKEIKEPLKKKIKSILDIKSKIGWQWHHVPEVNKDAELKKILASMGFKFTDIDVKKAIKSKRPSRKVGTRPEKSNVKRRKLT